MGFVNIYKRIICSYLKITNQLTILLKKKLKNGFFEGPENTEYTFNTLRDAFTQTPFLKYFNPNFPIRLETDVSDYALAGILTQFYKNHKKWHPVTFWFKKFIFAEKYYEIHD